MTGPVGNDLHFGRDMQMAGEATESKYRVSGDAVAGGSREFTAYHQKSEPSSSAGRLNSYGELQYGDYAYGGSVVGPVQALDAATVALTTTGKSWNRLKQASGGNPYVHTIYDAFKTDAMGYDVILEEVNTNWLETSMTWSYLEQAQKSLREASAKWKSEIAKRDPKAIVAENEAAYLRWIMEEGVSGKGNPTMTNFNKRIGRMAAFKRRGMDYHQTVKRFQATMAGVGYDWTNPPAEVTVLQLRTFVSALEVLLDADKRLSRIIAFTNKQKEQLRKEILVDGYKTPSGRTIALQYYAH